MRVLQLGPFPPPWGGVQTHIVSLRNYLRRHDVPCAVINITGNRKVNEDEVYYPKSARELTALLRSLEYDVVHTHVGGTMPTRVLGLLLATACVPGKRSVLTFHSGGFPSSAAGRSARARSLLGFVLRRLDAVIGVNAELVALFRRVGVRAERAHLVPPFSFGPELRALAERGRDGLSLPLREFFDAHSPVLLTVGLLEPEYDLELQIAALERVRARYPSAGLAIFGSGSLAEKLRDQIAAAPAGQHVYLAGDVPREQTLAAIGACDVLLRTTLYDGDAISVRESLCIGTPVIATDNSMRPPGVRLVPTHDLDALVGAVEAVVDGSNDPTSIADSDDEANLAAVVDLYARLGTRRIVGRVSRARSTR